ncbi:hypothetical protein F5Y13DRAFT_101237 [Hypoxylon sp. FL1857]|nr:hypothetical protein F5Y13DRAFT_101237 [Hypoxylon sp. FL1857]
MLAAPDEFHMGKLTENRLSQAYRSIVPYKYRKQLASPVDLCKPRFLHLARVDVRIGDTLRASIFDLVICVRLQPASAPPSRNLKARP